MANSVIGTTTELEQHANLRGSFVAQIAANAVRTHSLENRMEATNMV
jgi:hypothetical protein